MVELRVGLEEADPRLGVNFAGLVESVYRGHFGGWRVGDQGQ